MASSKKPRRNTQLDLADFEPQDKDFKTRSRAPSPEEHYNVELPLHLFFDSLKTNFADLDAAEGSDLNTESDEAEQDDWEELNDKRFQAAMAQMDNRLQDPDWVLERVER
jgi:hypothetical protein